MSFRTKVVAALEELENELGTSELETVPAAAAEVEAGSAEIATNVEEVEDLNVAAEEAENDIEALSDVQDVMKESVDGGEGLTEDAAEMAEIAVESICARLGFSKHNTTMPAMESFGQKGSRLTATKIAMENLGEKIKRGAQAVLNFIKMIWEKIKGFFAGLTRSRGAMEKHLTSLEARTGGIDAGATQKEAELSGGAAKSLSIDGKADKGTAETILANSQKLINVAVQMASILASEVTFDSATSTEKAKAVAEKLSSSVSHSFEKAKVEKGEEGVEHYGHFVNGMNVGVSLTKESNMGAFKLSITKTGTPAEKIKALTVQEVKAILGEAKKLLANLKAFDAVEKTLGAAAKSSITHIEKMVAAAKSGSKETQDEKGSEESAKTLNATMTVLREVANTSSKVGAAFPGMVFSAIKGVADYASASLNNLGSKEAKEKEPAKK